MVDHFFITVLIKFCLQHDFVTRVHERQLILVCGAGVIKGGKPEDKKDRMILGHKSARTNDDDADDDDDDW